VSWVVSSSDYITNPCVYYHQFDYILNYSVTGGIGYTAPTLTSTQYGSAYTPTLTTSALSYWLDNGASWSVPSSLVGSGNTLRWTTAQSVSGTVSGTQTTIFTYTYATNYVTVSTFTVSGSRVNIGTILTFTANGTYFFSGTTWMGTFTVTPSATQSLVGLYTYSVASITDSNYGLTAFVQTAPNLNVIFDELVFTYVANATTPPLGSNMTMTITCVHAYDNSPVSITSLNTLRNGTYFATGNFTDTSAVNITYEYDLQNFTVSDPYGLTNYTVNTPIYVTWGASAIYILEYWPFVGMLILLMAIVAFIPTKNKSGNGGS
jgi:hypothetical protein